MQIDLNDPSQLTRQKIGDLIASGDDRTHTQLRVTDAGIAYLSDAVGTQQLNGVAFRLETFAAGNDYVGQAASQDSEWIERLYRVLKENWPNPKTSYTDVF